MIYLIHESNMGILNKKVAHFSNKCKKYNVPFVFKVLDEKFVKQDGNIQKYYSVELAGEFKVGGWELVGALELLDSGNQIFKLKDIILPARFYSEYPTCEHCGINRYRRHFGIIYSQTEGFKLVGRSCLKDYFGQNIENIASSLSFFEEVKEYSEADGYDSNYIDVHEYLEAVCDIVDKYGFVSKTTNSSFITCEMAYGLLYPKKCPCNIKNKIYSDKLSFTGKHYNKVDDMLDYISACPATNDYLHNLKVVAKTKYAEKKQMGMLASLVNVYQKHVQSLQNAPLKCGFYGKLNERISINDAAITCQFSSFNQFGQYFLYRIVYNNYVFIWKTNTQHKDGIVSLTGTIKGHQEYKGEKQTWITRCRLLK